MLGTFNQHLLTILSNNCWYQSKPTSYMILVWVSDHPMLSYDRGKCLESTDMSCSMLMLGTFNQHLLMILSNNCWYQSKPTSLHDTGMGVGPPYAKL